MLLLSDVNFFVENDPESDKRNYALIFGLAAPAVITIIVVIIVICIFMKKLKDCCNRFVFCCFCSYKLEYNTIL